MSRSLILPIHLSMTGGITHGDQLDYRDVLPTWLHHHSSRMQSISLHGCRRSLENVLSCLASDIQALVSLELKFTQNRHQVFQLHAPNLRRHAPKLRRLNLFSVRLDLNECSDLTHLTLKYGVILAKELVSLLCRSPQLRELVLFCVTLDHWFEVGSTPATLAHLEVLQLKGLTRPNLEELLSFIQIPESAPLFNATSTDPARPFGIYTTSLRIR